MNDRIDRTAVRITPIDRIDSDYAFWKTQSYQRRLSTVEEIRREYHRWQDQPPSADFRDFAAILNKYAVRYLIVGGYAVAFHGHPRYTKDLDIWIERTPENARKLIAALDDFGFGAVGLDESDFLKPRQVVELGNPPNRIDLFTDLKGVEFAEAHERRVTDEFDAVTLHFIGREDLKRSKQAAGRLQDLADLENLGLL